MFLIKNFHLQFLNFQKVSQKSVSISKIPEYKMTIKTEKKKTNSVSDHYFFNWFFTYYNIAALISHYISILLTKYPG